MRLNQSAKVIFLSIITACFFAKSYSQITNKGSIISLTADAIVYSKSSLVNTTQGSVINNGNIVTDSSIINNSGSSLSGNGIYTMQDDFTNNGTFSAGTSTLLFTGNDYSFITNNTDKIYKLQLNKKPGKYVSIHDDEQVTKSVEFVSDGNYMHLNANTLTLGAGCTVAGFSDSRFFITNGTGALKKMSVGRTAFIFPVGFTGSTYNPVTITENGTADDYSVRCLENALINGASGNPVSKNGINVSWVINEAVSGGANATINAQWKPADELNGFNNAKCMLVRYASSQWDFNAGSVKAASGTTYKNVSRSSLSSFGYFTVLSSSQTSFTNSVDALIADNTQLKVYPTIVQNSFNISVPLIKNVQKMNVLVLDGSGKIVWQKQNADFQSQQISLPSLASGMYTVLINYDDKKFIQKIIVSQ